MIYTLAYSVREIDTQQTYCLVFYRTDLIIPCSSSDIMSEAKPSGLKAPSKIGKPSGIAKPSSTTASSSKASSRAPSMWFLLLYSCMVVLLSSVKTTRSVLYWLAEKYSITACLWWLPTPSKRLQLPVTIANYYLNTRTVYVQYTYSIRVYCVWCVWCWCVGPDGRAADDYIVGDKVYVGGTKPGVIAYLGETKFAGGDWAGVVLDQLEGKNDGSVQGIRYFQCEAKRGVFARPSKLTKHKVNEWVLSSTR